MFHLLKRIFNIFKYDDMESGYVWISLIGIIIRYVALAFLTKSLVSFLGVSIGILISIGAFILNWFIEFPLYKFTYLETGIFYESGFEPALGSFLYLLIYLVNCSILFIVKWFYFSWIYYVCIAGYIILVLTIRLIIALVRD